MSTQRSTERQFRTKMTLILPGFKDRSWVTEWADEMPTTHQPGLREAVAKWLRDYWRLTEIDLIPDSFVRQTVQTRAVTTVIETRQSEKFSAEWRPAYDEYGNDRWAKADA